eukprot:4582657-Pleurochrysis_carterae.AAC.3
MQYSRPVDARWSTQIPFRCFDRNFARNLDPLNSGSSLLGNFEAGIPFALASKHSDAHDKNTASVLDFPVVHTVLNLYTR